MVYVESTTYELSLVCKSLGSHRRTPFSDKLLAGQQPPDKHYLARLYLRVSEKARALEWLEKSFAELGEGPLRMKEPEFDALRDEPKYQKLRRRAGHLP